jgi:hypothetical protein
LPVAAGMGFDCAARDMAVSGIRADRDRLGVVVGTRKVGSIVA